MSDDKRLIFKVPSSFRNRAEIEKALQEIEETNISTLLDSEGKTVTLWSRLSQKRLEALIKKLVSAGFEKITEPTSV